MGMLKLLITGAAVAAGIHYATKKGENGKSFVDDIKEKAPEWMDKARPYIDQVKGQFSNNNMQSNGAMDTSGVHTPDPAM